jgi:hypothetical protein
MPSLSTQPRRFWTCGEKKKILEDFDIRIGNGESIRSISSSHGIQPTQYRIWRSKREAISSARKANHRAVTCGRGSRIRHLEKELVHWVLELREQGIAINYKYVVERVAQLDGNFAQLNFRQQYETVRRFCRSNGIVIRSGRKDGSGMPGSVYPRSTVASTH